MTRIRIALSQIDPTVGDLDGNAELVLGRTRRAAERGATLVAFPEMALTGYPVEDLALRSSFVEASRLAMEHLAGRLAAEGLGEIAVVVGYLDRCEASTPRLGRPAGAPQNAVAVLHRGRIAARSAKHHLPNYGVFDEYRYFVPGDRLLVARIGGVDIAIAVCEDLWQEGGPVAAARAARVGLLLSINASPYEVSKDDSRLDLVRRRAREADCTLAYVNAFGGQDELVFDGDSLIVDAEGRVLSRAARFHEELLVADLDLPQRTVDARLARTDDTVADDLTIRHVVLTEESAPPPGPAAEHTIAPALSDDAEIYGALVTGLRDYVAKNGFKSVLLGLSGGIDSALVAAIAADAVGGGNVYGVSMPSSYSSEHSRDDAADTAERIGLDYRQVPIAPMVDAYLAALGLTGLAEENLQARVRGTTLMGLSNQEGHLVLATGNKSELACGYSTLYGDAVGGFAPIKDVPKTAVWRLARWRNAEAERRGEVAPIPVNSITKPPSAELRPGQVDTDSLPPYDLLDAILDDYVERDMGRDAIVAAGFEPALVDRILALVDTAEYKRRQYPPGTKISLKAFGRDRRLPITNHWRESG
ncbi:NAD+ synthase [Embleya scabrispora]|uniref:Glutamine-dependent NAD(+) synthetase n=1 Tax=Embleya scabrispora TaxID=159449 RepID=A0A1T3P244_9ACTN|nr:NAD+ synthase [Embleya scabrispora]OPC83189.1 NAD+ synthase [Embleya scabrispora]